MMSASGVPDLDNAMSKEERKADCYASFFLSEDENGESHLTQAEKTPYRLNTETPIWNCYRRLCGSHNKQKAVYLVIQLFDYDTMSKDDFIGECIVDISKLDTEEVQTAEIKLGKEALKKSKGRKCEVQFQVLRRSDWPTQKTIFFIRHGESKWNEAEHDILKHGNVASGAAKMASGRDHPLNHVGIQQAISLNRRWKATKQRQNIQPEDLSEGGTFGAEPLEADNEAFFNADLILSSPLTRALQTCLLGLADHRVLNEKGLTLQRQLREVKNRIGWDALGKEVGERIKTRVREQLMKEKNLQPKQLANLSAEDIRKVTSPKIDLNDCMSHWWDPGRDTRMELSERLTDLIHTLRYSTAKTIICVGHSLFFREICRAFIGGGHRTITKNSDKKDGAMQSNSKPLRKLDLKSLDKRSWEALSEVLQVQKLGNAACLMTKFDFSRPEMEHWNIKHAKLMFGSTFKLEEKEKKSIIKEDKIESKDAVSA